MIKVYFFIFPLLIFRKLSVLTREFKLKLIN